MKYKITLKVYPQEGLLPPEEKATWIEESDLNTEALLKKILNDVKGQKNDVSSEDEEC